MGELTKKDILEIAIERSGALNNYWNIFIAVSLGVVGVMASGETFTDSDILKIVLTVAFVVFAYANLDAILCLGKLRQALINKIKEDEGLKPIVESIKPAKNWHYVVFHVLLDISVIFSVWFVPWLSTKP